MRKVTLLVALFFGCTESPPEMQPVCPDGETCTRELASGFEYLHELDADDENIVFMNGDEVMRYSLAYDELSLLKDLSGDDVSHSDPHVSGDRVALKTSLSGGRAKYGIYSLDGTELGSRIFDHGHTNDMSRLSFKFRGDYLAYLRFAEDTNFGLGYEDPPEWDLVVAALSEENGNLVFHETILGRTSLWAQFDLNELGDIVVTFAEEKGWLVPEGCRITLTSYRLVLEDGALNARKVAELFNPDGEMKGVCEDIWVNDPDIGIAYTVAEVAWFGGSGDGLGSYLFIVKNDDPLHWFPIAGEGEQWALPDVPLVSRPQIGGRRMAWLDRHADPHSPMIAMRYMYGYTSYDAESQPRNELEFPDTNAISPPENHVITEYVLLDGKVVWGARGLDGLYSLYLTKLSEP